MAQAVAPSWSYTSNRRVQVREANVNSYELWKDGVVVAVSNNPCSLLRFAFIKKIVLIGEVADMASKFDIPMSEVMTK